MAELKDSTMTKIVVLVRNYFPFSNAVGVCAEAIIGAIKELYPDTKLFVVCEKTKINQLNYENINGVVIKRFTTKRTIRLLKSKNKVSRFFSRLFGFLYDFFSFYTANREMVKLFENELKDLKLTAKDIVIPFCAPFESIIASIKVRKKHDFYLIPILYDLYSGCKYTNRGTVSMFLKRPFNRRLEKEMEQLSSHILYSSCWEMYLKKSISNKKATHVEVPLLYKHTYPEVVPFFDKNKTNIVYCGNFNKNVRKSDLFCKLFDNYLSQNKGTVLHIVGNGNCDNNILKLKSKFIDSVVLYGFLPHDDAINLLHQAQAIVVVGNENKKQFPSKISEALSFSTKIIVVSKVVHPYLDFVSKNSNCFVVDKYNVNNTKSFEKFLFEPFVKEDYFAKPCFRVFTPIYSASIIGTIGNLNEKQ